MTVIASVLHFLVDGVCGFAMIGRFTSGEDYLINLLLYNFCAFALQMPFGLILDYLPFKTRFAKEKCSLFTMGAGCALTALGAYTHPVILGIGNALFHIGGGTGVLYEDFALTKRGKLLGIFVAPGAIGLFLGMNLPKYSFGGVAFLITLIVLLFGGIAGSFICYFSSKMKQQDFVQNIKSENDVCLYKELPENTAKEKTITVVILGLCLFLVVFFRSYVSLSVSFSWKSGFLMGFISVICVAFGKSLGGIIASYKGFAITGFLSLILSAGFFAFGDIPCFGLLALLLFNMTMPLTLYALAYFMPKMMGFSFGLLTFALFLGYLPKFFGVKFAIDMKYAAAICAVISVFLLFPALRKLDMERKEFHN